MCKANAKHDVSYKQHEQTDLLLVFMSWAGHLSTISKHGVSALQVEHRAVTDANVLTLVLSERVTALKQRCGEGLTTKAMDLDSQRFLPNTRDTRHEGVLGGEDLKLSACS